MPSATMVRAFQVDFRRRNFGDLRLEFADFLHRLRGTRCSVGFLDWSLLPSAPSGRNSSPSTVAAVGRRVGVGAPREQSGNFFNRFFRWIIRVIDQLARVRDSLRTDRQCSCQLGVVAAARGRWGASGLAHDSMRSEMIRLVCIDCPRQPFIGLGVKLCGATLPWVNSPIRPPLVVRSLYACPPVLVLRHGKYRQREEKLEGGLISQNGVVLKKIKASPARTFQFLAGEAMVR